MLRLARAQAGLKQQQVAGKIGMKDFHGVANAESSGIAGLEMLVRILGACGIHFAIEVCQKDGTPLARVSSDEWHEIFNISADEIATLTNLGVDALNVALRATLAPMREHLGMTWSEFAQTINPSKPTDSVKTAILTMEGRTVPIKMGPFLKSVTQRQGTVAFTAYCLDGTIISRICSAGMGQPSGVGS